MRINGTPVSLGRVRIATAGAGPAARDPGPLRACPFCTSDRLLERLAGGWVLCNVCAKIYRDPD